MKRTNELIRYVTRVEHPQRDLSSNELIRREVHGEKHEVIPHAVESTLQRARVLLRQPPVRHRDRNERVGRIVDTIPVRESGIGAGQRWWPGGGKGVRKQHKGHQQQPKKKS